MSVARQHEVTFESRFATELPELAVAWQAERVAEPQLLVLNEPLAAELGFDPAALRDDEGVRMLVGNRLAAGSRPVAQGYAGHQFGNFAPRLGDGRALLLGEVVDGTGRLRDVHLKGSGPTPFSRGGDGLAAVGPMLREYIVSEAMHALGVPTTRALAVVATGTPVHRDTVLPGAVLTRVASSHLRVGTFQYAATAGDTDLLRRLADHAIARHHPEASQSDEPYLALLEAVIAAQASLVARWMLVGFVHGVMNTDNVTISGETIDYGPCAFMEAFDPATVYSSIDVGGRYAYGSQPVIAQWNLARLAEAMLPLLHDRQEQAVEVATDALRTFPAQYELAWRTGTLAKLGVADASGDERAALLVDDLLAMLHDGRVDFTSCFRALSARLRNPTAPPSGGLADAPAFDAWELRWRALGPDADLMDRVNPIYIPRNHLVEEALAAATDGELDPMHRLLDVVTDPYRYRAGLERHEDPAPESFGRYRTYCGT